MSLEENKAIILRLIEVLNNKDWDTMEKLMSPNIIARATMRAGMYTPHKWLRYVSRAANILVTFFIFHYVGFFVLCS
jgi:hypothetical protein